MPPQIAAALSTRADQLKRRFVLMHPDDAHNAYCLMAEGDPELFNAFMDEYPELHARYSVPPPQRRAHQARVIEYRREAGHWVAVRVVVSRTPRRSPNRGCERRTRPRGRRERRVARATSSSDPGEPGEGPSAAPLEAVAA